MFPSQFITQRYNQATTTSEVLGKVFHQHSYINKQIYGGTTSTHLQDIGLFTTGGPWRTEEHKRNYRLVLYYLQKLKPSQGEYSTQLVGLTQYSKQRCMHLVSSKVCIWFLQKGVLYRNLKCESYIQAMTSIAWLN